MKKAIALNPFWSKVRESLISIVPNLNLIVSVTLACLATKPALMMELAYPQTELIICAAITALVTWFAEFVSR